MAHERMLPARVFIGRSDELALVRELVADAVAGRGGFGLVAGEPGIGKTALLDQLAADATEMGVNVLWGRCAEQGAAPAFWPWMQVARQFVAQAADPPADLTRLAQLDGAQLDGSQPELALSSSERFRLFDAVSQALRSAGPSLVVLEDLHRGDASSLRLLEHIVDDLVRSPLTVVGSYRSNEITADHPLRRVVSAGGPGRLHITLSGLNLDDVAALARTVGVTSVEEAAELHRRSGGNPLFVTELTRLGGGELPLSLTEAIRRRLDRLGEPARNLLAVAAVIGREFDGAYLALLVGRDIAQVEVDLRHAETERLLTGRWSFVHSLVAEVLIDDLEPAALAAINERAARLVLERPEEPTGPELTLVAHHLLEAARWRTVPDAWAWARAAGREATGQLGFEEAARLLTEAEGLARAAGVDDEEQTSLAIETGEAHQRAGRLDAARSRFEAAAGIARRLHRPDLLARSATAVGLAITTAGRVDRALVALLEEALQVTPVDDQSIRAGLLARLGLEMYWDSSGGETGRQLSREAVAVAAAGGGTEATGRAKFALLFTLRGPDADLGERIDLGTELVLLGIDAGDDEIEFQARVRHASDVLESAAVGRYRHEVAMIIELAERSQQPLWAWWSTMHEGCLAILDGRFDEASELTARLERLGNGLGAAPTVVYAAAQRALMARDLGRSAEHVGALLRLVPQFPLFTILRAIHAWLLADLGDHHRAIAEAEPLWHDLDGVGRDALWLTTMALLGEAAVGCERPDAAGDVYSRLLPHAERFAVAGTPATWGSVDRFLGVMARATGEMDQAERHLISAVDTHRRSGAAALLARSQADLASLYRARAIPGDPDRGAAAAAEARTIAVSLGLTGILDRLDPADRGSRVLSGREMEVMALVVDGSTNRQIGASLHISVHTVERHLANIYAKIGVRNRTEAAAYANHHHLV